MGIKLSKTIILNKFEQIKKKKFDSEQSSHGDKQRSNGLNLDEHFFRSMGIIDVIGHLLRNGGEMTKLLALGEALFSTQFFCMLLTNFVEPGTLINLCQNPKNVPLIRQFVGVSAFVFAACLIERQLTCRVFFILYDSHALFQPHMLNKLRTQW